MPTLLLAAEPTCPCVCCMEGASSGTLRCSCFSRSMWVGSSPSCTLQAYACSAGHLAAGGDPAMQTTAQQAMKPGRPAQGELPLGPGSPCTGWQPLTSKCPAPAAPGARRRPSDPSAASPPRSLAGWGGWRESLRRHAGRAGQWRGNHQWPAVPRARAAQRWPQGAVLAARGPRPASWAAAERRPPPTSSTRQPGWLTASRPCWTATSISRTSPGTAPQHTVPYLPVP